MIPKLFNSKLFYIFISIVFAGFLFFNANSNSAQNDGSIQSGGQVYTATLENIPISLQYNGNKYFISGYTSTATVTLSSSNQVEILQEKSTDLRSFKLLADLSEFGAGTHTVPIVVKNLSSNINARTNPSSFSVTIENKKTKDFTIDAIVDKTLVPDGYTLTDASTNPSKVAVTAGTNSIKNIYKVQAVLPSDTDLTKETTIAVNLEAIDSSGKVVPASFSQNSVKMTVKLIKNS
ncbi:MAG: hypothetical protein LBI13_08105 [Streptococcaceae bacterium]|jgi:YbbR domain-containing protein|nr:hypothetical protein [Streptococcaceae bacterium]